MTVSSCFRAGFHISYGKTGGKSPKITKIRLLKTGVRLAVGRFLRVLEPNSGFEVVKPVKNRQKSSKFDFTFHMVKPVKIAKNHRIMTPQKWGPFGRRTLSSCFRA
jgi:hypothetical protein